MSKKIAAALLLSSVIVLSACNTVEGAGKDVQSAGKAVEKSAD
jgi:predicted small secreted protein